MNEVSQLMPVLERVERNLEAYSTKQREISDRVGVIEQRSVTPLPEARATSPDCRGSGIVKVHNHRGSEPLYIVGHKASVADALPKPQSSGISLGRYLAAGLLGDKCGDAEALRHVAEVKGISTGTSGLVVPVEYQGQWIDLLRSQLVLVQAGAVTVPMTQKTLSAAALTGDPTAAWHTESASITATDPTFAARTLTAQTVAARCTASVEATQDSPNFGDQLALAMARAIAVEIDRVGLVGSGSAPEPRGILNASGIGSVATVGTVVSYAKVLDGVQLLLEANVPLDVATKFAIMSPRTWSRYENLATGIASDKSPLPRPRALADTRFLTTTGIPNTMSTDKSALFLGDFRDLVLGIRTDASVEALKVQTYASNLIIEFIAHARCDWLVTRPASFCALTGIA